MKQPNTTPLTGTGLLGLARTQSGLYGAAIVAMCAGILFTFIVPAITRVVIDGFQTAPSGETDFVPSPLLARALESTGLSGTAAALCLVGLAVIAITAIAGALQFLRGRWAAQASEAILRDLRNKLYGHLDRLPMSFFDKQSAGDLVQRATSDVETVRVFLSAQIVEIARAIMLLVFVTPILFFLNVKLAWISLALMPFVVAYSLLFFGRITRMFKDVDEAEGSLTTVIQENLTGVRVVRAFGRREFEEQKFEAANTKHCEATWVLMKMLGMYWSLSDLICMTQGALVLFFGAKMVFAGDLSLGTLVAFTEYSALVIWPVRQMGRTLVDAGKARVAMVRIGEVLHSPTEGYGETFPSDQPKLSGAFSINDLTFGFDVNKPVLSKINLDVPAGTSVALVGPPGSGKSVLVELMLRLHDYKTGSGSIRFDGHELHLLPRDLVRSNAAVVMQNPFLFARSITRNLQVGRTGATEQQLFAATADAAIHDSILGFENGYETLLGERGVTLSGGQKQRVAIARALLKEAPLLVLDDALSAVDLDTEERILGSLARRKTKATTVLISHRLSTIKHADQICVMDQGSIIERGTHEQLLAAKDHYAHLWTLQSSLQEQVPNPKSVASKGDQA